MVERGLQRIAEHEREVVRADTVDAQNRRGRMHEEGEVERVGRLPDGAERRSSRSRPSTLEPISTHRKPCRATRSSSFTARVGRLQGDDGRPQEAGRMRGHHLGDRVVVKTTELGRRRRVGPVAEHERWRRQHLTLDAEPVQIHHPQARIEDLLGQAAVPLAPSVERAASIFLADEARPAGIGVTGEKVVPATGQDVGVDVDRAHRAR